ncbi:hypothetical protein IW136_005231 [Coemansia sp. RSA 678]|nr:hypothetical protein IW136_005231 [Coemansia sp. RSA 678]
MALHPKGAIKAIKSDLRDANGILLDENKKIDKTVAYMLNAMLDLKISRNVKSKNMFEIWNELTLKYAMATINKISDFNTTDTLPALAARQDTGGQHRRSASQMDAESDNAQAAPAKRCWEAETTPADEDEDYPPTESSETESMAGDAAETVSTAMDMDQDSSFTTGNVDQHGSMCA